jgi:hypothetical protein
VVLGEDVDWGVSEGERGGDLKRSESDQTQPYLPALLSDIPPRNYESLLIIFVLLIDVV